MDVLLRTRCGCERIMTLPRNYPASIQVPLVGDGSKVRVFNYTGKLDTGMRVYVERLT